jgi:hypothetical protein
MVTLRRMRRSGDALLCALGTVSDACCAGCCAAVLFGEGAVTVALYCMLLSCGVHALRCHVLISACPSDPFSRAPHSLFLLPVGFAETYYIYVCVCERDRERDRDPFIRNTRTAHDTRTRASVCVRVWGAPLFSFLFLTRTHSLVHT